MVKHLCYIASFILLSLLLCGSVKAGSCVEYDGIGLTDASSDSQVLLTGARNQEILLHFRPFARAKFISFTRYSLNTSITDRACRIYHCAIDPTWAVLNHKPLYIRNRILLI